MKKFNTSTGIDSKLYSGLQITAVFIVGLVRLLSPMTSFQTCYPWFVCKVDMIGELGRPECGIIQLVQVHFNTNEEVEIWK